MSASATRSSTPSAIDPRMPDFFIVGHAKSGTTALYEMLRRHPQVFMPEYKGGAGKEPWYFAQDNPNPQRSGRRDISFTGRVATSEDDYLSLFEGALSGQLRGEASSSYLWSRSAPGRIAAVRPDARIIAIIREPASFLRSLHLQLLQNRHEAVFDFREAVELDQARLENKHIPSRSYWPQALIYSDRVRYVEQLRRYRDVFAAEQVLVLIYDDFRDDNAGTLARVERFLGVEEVPIEPVEANPTIAARERVEGWRRQLRQGRDPLWWGLRTVGKTLTTRTLRERFFYPLVPRAVFSEPPAPDEEFMAELRRRFKPEVVALSEYLQRDLVALWGYDDLG
ncbi:MAG TPA: sulfotransferase [Solirubrobacteraceae bacterium]|nr:sulfotransferase [Solirubrobacteraceae bacterium]